MDNKFENFTVTNLNDMIEKINIEEANKESNHLFLKIENCIRCNAKINYKPKYINISESNHDTIHKINIKYLTSNGFKVWRVNAKDKNPKSNRIYTKHVISWKIDDHKAFEKEIFNNYCFPFISDKDYVYSFEEVI